MNKRYIPRGVQPRRTALTVALAMGLGFTGFAYGQATTGSIFGTAPAGVGETVMVQGANGTNREVAVDASGRYSVTVPVGRYTVTLRKDGQVLATQENVGVSPGSGTQVPFAAASTQNAQNLSAVQVVASALPAIDVTSVNSSTIITAADLAKLPVSRSAESIALLAPSTAKGSSYFPNAVAFAGSSVSENAYYVNGYTTGAPYKNIGGFQLPYGSIDQQETLTGGYDAKYGRSDGGVINQIGKRGTNEWHFGAQVAWEPRFLESSPKNTYYPNPTVPGPAGTTTYQLASPGLVGTMNRYRNDNKQWETIYSAYVGGPLIKDKLFMFLAGETTKTHSTSVQSAVTGSTSTVEYNRDKNDKFYGKLDWNITDNNVLELTALKNNQTTGAGSTYNFDYNTLKATSFLTPNDVTKNNAAFYVGHFTSYITDSATLSVLYGKATFDNPTSYGNHSTLPMIVGSSNIPAAKLPAGGFFNPQTNRSWYSDKASNGSHGLRVDFDYKLGDHDLAVGIDNMHYAAKNQGPSQYNPFDPSIDYFWRYRANGTVRKYIIGWATSMSTDQKAYYLQDSWQVSSNVLVKVGLRNDHFINYNDRGQAFVEEKNQWEPRIGASWDVNGDSSFKVYGNVGRYYLALPENAAERAANISTYTYQIFNYASVNPDGTPNITTSPDNGKLHSPDGEFGLPKDPQQVTARNLKAEYMDEFIAGFDKKLNDNWTYGAKAMWRDLKTAIDDECSPGQMATKMTAMGLNPNDYSDSLYGPAYCRLINPGQTNDMLVRSNDGTSTVIVPMTQQDWGYTQGVKRKVGSMNLYLEHPFDGKWQARVDYTYTRGFGNTEGQVRSDFGQSDVSKTEDWDAWQLMDGQNGELFNVRKHQLRVRGAYQFTPEWLVSGTMLAQSGVPQECLGYYGPNGDQDPVGYGSNYHWCAGKRITPGFKHTPWTKEINLGVHYTPAFADHKLGVNLDVFNLLNEQKATQTDPTQDADVGFISPTYGMPIYYQTPRTVRLSVTYDY